MGDGRCEESGRITRSERGIGVENSSRCNHRSRSRRKSYCLSGKSRPWGKSGHISLNRSGELNFERLTDAPISRGTLRHFQLEVSALSEICLVRGNGTVLLRVNELYISLEPYASAQIQWKHVLTRGEQWCQFRICMQAQVEGRETELGGERHLSSIRVDDREIRDTGKAIQPRE